jgi:serine/threonine protein kinase
MKKGEGEGSGAELIRARGAGVVMRRGPDSMNNSTQDETAILDEARRLPEGQRAPYLERTCGADAELRQRVASRLAALPRSRPAASGTAADNEATVDSSAAGGPPVPVLRAAEETPGCVVGRYKLLEMIGEGGFGCVYVAEQKEPVKRRVALKIIKLGMDTRQVVARFEAERQALAMMDHPNIAKVLDAGATDTGRPFFVMELVRGVRITDYCDENKLSTRKRLDLFILVCRAIEHAHQKGIIHRDIKPSNILVATENGAAVPKVIDFGIAKATSGRLTDKTVYTQADQFVGTPAYMSPEQAEASGLDIDTRSDIYSLGVLLYELLTSETPFESKNLLARGFDEMRRIIREIEPQLPSLRLRAKHDTGQTSAATLHGTDAPKLINLMRGDLDWVVMKCLEKDRNRRYETAGSLVADVQRFLDNEPVAARSPSGLYRFRKLVQRNRLAFAAAAGIWITLVAALGVTSWYVIKERQERDLAEIESNAANSARQNSDKARELAEADEQKALESQKQAVAAQQRAEAATARALESEKAAKAALQEAREETEKARIADQQAQVSKSDAQTARRQASLAMSEAEKQEAEKAEAVALQTGLRREAEAARQRAENLLTQARADEAASAAEALQLRTSLSNFCNRLDALPPAAVAAIADSFLAAPGPIQPWAIPLLRGRADWRARQGDWTGAAVDFTRLLELEPDAPEAYDALAYIAVQTGDLSAYSRICTALLLRFRAANDLAIGRLVARDCLLAPTTNVDLAAAAALARLAMESGTNDSHFPANALTLGLAEYRQGRFAEAAARAATALAAAEQDAPSQAQASALLALALQQLKQTNLALTNLAAGRIILQTKPPKTDGGDRGPRWKEYAAAAALLREAGALIEAPPQSTLNEAQTAPRQFPPPVAPARTNN